MTDIKNFNIRVYGLIINNKGEILISTEKYKNHTLRKFIGGGLEKGEGLKAGLKREFQEETGCDIKMGDLFYINDFFQSSLFVATDQIISIYYMVQPKVWDIFLKALSKPANNQFFSWENIADFDIESLSLPIDKVVLMRLKNNP
ncbi:MAG: NUDIX domain-containing protein [Putridiphycobacter sp.]|nr:NUDIX domain-containing protein [Putridiphycobacter sp.]